LWMLLAPLVAWGQEKVPNKLASESSPYLLQHAYNPVQWYPWGEAALQKAKAENKPIIISIGYASCHWCHVMEEESFEDETVAEIMNEYFVSIKVDREERPDIDQIYVDVSQLMTGSAGWPLNIIAMPDTKPFFAGTYFPKEQWITILEKTIDLYKKDREKLAGIATKITSGVKSISQVINVEEELQFTVDQSDQTLEVWKSTFDLKNGGYDRDMKFPMPGSILTLLEYAAVKESPEIDRWIKLTLDQIARGGIYDHLGGGFARYTVDREWKVPHFEKMLYDNAQLVSLFSKAYQRYGSPLYKRVAVETIDFLKSEMKDKSGGYYSSIDADSEGEEGTFYVWTDEELKKLLGQSYDEFTKLFAVTPTGNWENGKNVLYLRQGVDIDVSLLELSKYKLLEYRKLRSAPATDTKVLTSWNSLLISAYVNAYLAFQDEKHLNEAVNIGKFILAKMSSKEGGLQRSFHNGTSSINGFLDDYAFTIAACLDLYSVTFDESWLMKGKELSDYVDQHFSDTKNQYFFYTSAADEELLTRKQEIADNVIASSNSVMARNLHQIGHYFYLPELVSRSENMLKGVVPDMQEYGSFYYSWFALHTMKLFPYYEVAVVGSNAVDLSKQMRKELIPNALFLGSKKEENLELLKNKYVKGKTMIYVCRDKSCRLPVQNTELAIKQINYDF